MYIFKLGALLATAAIVGMTGCTPAATTTTTTPAPGSAAPTTVASTAVPTPAPGTTTTATAPASTQTVSASAPATPAPSAPSSSGGSETKPVSAEAYRIVTPPSGSGYYFVTPSGGIHCGLSVANTTNRIVCVVEAKLPEVQKCDGVGNELPGARIEQGGKALTTCFTEAGEWRSSKQASKVLNYGESLLVNDITCVSAESGVTCSDARTGHKITISKESVKVS